MLDRKNFFHPLWLWTLIFVLLPSASRADPRQTPLRIVSLKPNITDILVSLESANQVVGITKFCTRPNESAKVVADYNSIQVEDVVRLKPDFVITSRENAQERQERQLAQLGVRVVLVDFRTYDEMLDSLKKIGAAIGKTDEATRLVTNIENKMTTIRQSVQARVPKGASFVAIVQRQPLMVAAGETYISALFEKVGLKNIFGKNKIRYPLISPEDFLRTEATYAFDLSYDAAGQEVYLTKKVIVLRIEDFLAEPKSVDALAALVEQL